MAIHSGTINTSTLDTDSLRNVIDMFGFIPKYVNVIIFNGKTEYVGSNNEGRILKIVLKNENRI